MSITFCTGANAQAETLNVSNQNYAALAEIIPLPAPEHGELTAQEMLIRVAGFLNRQDPSVDEGLARKTSQGARGATFVSYGRRPGYLREKALRLGQMALQSLFTQGPEAKVWWS